MFKTKIAAIEIPPALVLKGQLSMVNDVVLTGTFEGDLQTLGQLTVVAGAQATGTIQAGSLVLQPGNQVDATIKVGTPAAKQSLDLAKKAGDKKWPLTFKKLKELAMGRA